MLRRSPARPARRGLASAVIEGFLAAKGAVLVAADADGQHDFHLLTELLAAVDGGAGLALASRYVPGGSVGAWDERLDFNRALHDYRGGGTPGLGRPG